MKNGTHEGDDQAQNTQDAAAPAAVNSEMKLVIIWAQRPQQQQQRLWNPHC